MKKEGDLIKLDFLLALFQAFNVVSVNERGIMAHWLRLLLQLLSIALGPI
jgi:hypothetical protein